MYRNLFYGGKKSTGSTCGTVVGLLTIVSAKIVGKMTDMNKVHIIVLIM